MTRRLWLLFSLFFVNLLFVSLCSGSVAAAQAPERVSPAQASPRLVVFPFVSDEPRLGFALADRLTHAFSDSGISPELALGLVPPLVLEENTFLSPLNLLGEAQTGTLHAAALLRETLGVETAVTGRVRYSGTGLELHLFVARAEGAHSFLFRAPEAFPDRLISEARAALSAFAGLTPSAEVRLGLDLSSPYGTFIDGLINLGSGFPEEALPLLERAAAALSAEGRWQRRAEALAQLLSRRPAPARVRYPLLSAVVALNTQPFDEAAVARAFAGSELPLATLWGALLAAQSGDAAAARAGFAALDSERYPFAWAQRLLYRLGSGAAPGAVKAELERLLRQQPDSLSVLIGGLFIAQSLRDGALEQELATRLTRLAPAFAYLYERLSQRAFDRDDPRTAAVALRTASRLEPENDLYWTNLGWAYYLLNVLGESEAASKRALELNPNELVALYNLGLVEVVTGRLEAALNTYAEATTRDLEDDNSLDPAATADLRDALTRYPQVPGVHYALATLLEAGGDTRAAAAQYARYAERGGPQALVASARERARTLRAPPPPLRITPGARVGVGPDALPFARYVPGDLLYARFELSTPGDELPLPLTTTLRLQAADGTVVAESAQTEWGPLLPATVALVIDDTSLELPPSLPPGRYRLVVAAEARGREGRTVLPLRVAAHTPPLVRQLLGRGITLRGLAAGLPLYEPEDASVSNRALLGTLLTELSLAARAAAETSPEVARGRFAGQRGAALFNASDAGDVRDFLGFLLQGGAGTDAPFAELYARWALAGAPVP